MLASTNVVLIISSLDRSRAASLTPLTTRMETPIGEKEKASWRVLSFIRNEREKNKERCVVHRSLSGVREIFLNNDLSSSNHSSSSSSYAVVSD